MSLVRVFRARLSRVSSCASLCASLCALFGAQQLFAQRAAAAIPEPPSLPLSVRAFEDLTFGVVLPGIPITARPRGPHSDRVGKFQIAGAPGLPVRLEFLLPIAMQATGGASIPLTFGPGDALSVPNLPAAGTLFNPHSPFVTVLNERGHLQIRIGGTASPGVPQSPGTYTATIHLVVYDLGT